MKGKCVTVVLVVLPTLLVGFPSGLFRTVRVKVLLKFAELWQPASSMMQFGRVTRRQP